MHAITWRKCENIMISERRQSKRPYIVRFHFYVTFIIVKFPYRKCSGGMPEQCGKDEE